MGQGELALLCFVIDDRTLTFFLKYQLPWSSPLKASLFKMFAFASFKKNPKKRHVLGLLHDLCLYKNI